MIIVWISYLLPATQETEDKKEATGSKLKVISPKFKG
jgi:hypothetical protein